MKSFIQFIARSAAAVFISVNTWLFSFFAFNQGFLKSGFIAIIAGAVVFYIIKFMMKHRTVKGSNLTRSEYRLVQDNLKTAKGKIQRLQKAFFKIGSISNALQNYETLRVVKKIYATTKNEPRRFFKVEEFYYSHLDSLVELAEKYAFLNSQPVKTRELNDSLRETQRTIQGLSESVKKDLYKMLENDIDTLKFEIDVAKKNIDRKNKN